VVRFDAPSEHEIAGDLVSSGVPADTAMTYARLSLGDADVAHELATPEGVLLRDRAQELVRQALAGDATATAPWTGLLEAVKARGERVSVELQARADAEIAMYPRKEQRRVEGEWGDRVKRGRRRVETGALDLALSLAETWLLDLASLAWGAPDLVRNSDRVSLLEADAGVGGGRQPQALRAAVELIEDTRLRLPLNVSEDLACEALAYRLERVLAG
jgi:DNA polymerase-3 subunit delta'